MTFGEKLLKLRKEKGLSQEALAERLNTTRQAVSKWENNQGYPETEKLLMISNLFNVSVDSLLKENAQEVDPEGRGYYVSRECAEGYLLQEKKLAKRISAGMAILVGAVVPIIKIGLDNFISIGATIILLTMGIGILATTMFMDDQYKKLSKELLILDNSFYSELKTRYEIKKRKLIFITILGIILLVTGAVLLKNTTTSIFLITEFACVSLTVGIYSLAYVIGIIDSYETLLNSDERLNQFHVRLWRKMKDKLTK